LSSIGHNILNSHSMSFLNRSLYIVNCSNLEDWQDISGSYFRDVYPFFGYPRKFFFPKIFIWLLFIPVIFLVILWNFICDDAFFYIDPDLLKIKLIINKNTYISNIIMAYEQRKNEDSLQWQHLYIGLYIIIFVYKYIIFMIHELMNSWKFINFVQTRRILYWFSFPGTFIAGLVF